MKNVFIRGSVVRYVHLPAGSVDTQLLEDATRRGELEGALLGGGMCLRKGSWLTVWGCRGGGSTGKG